MRLLHVPSGLLLVLCLLAAPLRAEDRALILIGGEAPGFLSGRDSAAPEDFADPLRAAGFTIVTPDSRAPGALRRAAGRVEAALAAGEVARLVIVAAGPFAHSDHDSWLLGDGADRPGRAGVPAVGLSLGMLGELAAQARGRAAVLVAPGPAPDAAGPGLDAGLGPFRRAEGVTYATGPAPALARVLRDHLLDRGTALTAAARAAPDSVAFSGFLSDEVGLMGRAAVAPSPAAVEQGFWRAVQALDTVAAYEVYLDDYPEGPHAEDARERIDRLKAAPERRAAQEEQALELSREARREVQRNLSLLGFDPRGIDGIFGPGTRSALTAWQRANGFAETGYLTGNQLLRLRDQARARAEELEEEARQRRQQEERQDRAYWRETGRGSDEAGLRAYLERYPDGQFADLARQRLAEIEDSKLSEAERAERDAWQAAREMDTIAGYRDFLDAYPDSTFAEAARSRLDELRRKTRDSEAARRARAEEDRFVNNRIARLLVEKRLEQLRFDPGTVDGAFDAEARRAIRRYQRSRGLPVTGYVSQDTMVRLMAGR